MVSLMEACNNYVEWLTEARDACQKVVIIYNIKQSRQNAVLRSVWFQFFIDDFE